MLAGFAEKEFTPAEGNMPGEIGPYYAKGTRTPLMAHVAVITGGVQPVALAIANRYAQEGAKVYILTDSESEAISDGIRTLKCNIADFDDVTRCFTALQEDVGVFAGDIPGEIRHMEIRYTGLCEDCKNGRRRYPHHEEEAPLRRYGIHRAPCRLGYPYQV